MTCLRWMSLAFVLAASLVIAPVSRAEGPAAPDPLKVIAGYVAAVQKDGNLSAEQKKKIETSAAMAVKDPAQTADFITSTLAELHPVFAGALAALANEKNDQALPILEMLRGSPDVYLAAHAVYFQARALLGQEAYDQALPLLADYTPGGKYFDKTTYGGEALFMRGVCERKLLKRSEAVKSFTDFLDAFPQAPERLRLGANQHLLELKSMKDLSLDDVDDRMDFSRARLTREQSDKDITQAEQKRIVDILEKLIKEQEDKEKQQGSGGGKGGGKGGKSGSKGGPKGSRAGNPAEKSVAPVGEAKVGNLHDIRRGNPEDTWGADKERQRQEVLDALKAKFPQRYRELLKEYYQNMTDEKDAG